MWRSAGCGIELEQGGSFCDPCWAAENWFLAKSPAELVIMASSLTLTVRRCAAGFELLLSKFFEYATITRAAWSMHHRNQPLWLSRASDNNTVDLSMMALPSGGARHQPATKVGRMRRLAKLYPSEGEGSGNASCAARHDERTPCGRRQASSHGRTDWRPNAGVGQAMGPVPPPRNPHHAWR